MFLAFALTMVGFLSKGVFIWSVGGVANLQACKLGGVKYEVTRVVGR